MNLSKVTSDAEQAMSIKYNTMVYELKRTGKKVLVLSLGEAFFDIPLFPFDTLPFPDIYHYSDSRGLPELREKLAEFFLRKYDIPINYEKEILITAGSKAAIHFTLMAILNPGDEVIIPEPFWVSYPEQVKLCYGNPVCVPYGKTVFNFEEYIGKRTKAIIICNPNNPTGYTYSKKELEHLLFLTSKYNIWLLCDEAYSEFVDDNGFISPGKLDREKKHTIIFNSISKNYGISGWRLGYVIGDENLIFNILKVNQHIITCPATILEFYVKQYFYDILKHTEPQIKELIQKRKEVARFMKEIGLNALPGEATFYFFVSIAPSQLSSEEFCTKLLHEYFISTVPGIGYGRSCDKFIRVSIGTSSIEEIKPALKKIKTLIDDTSKFVTHKSSNVLVVAGGLWQIPLINFLKAKGHTVFVVDPYLHSPGVKLADKHIQCDVRDFEKVKNLVKNQTFSIITTDQSDISVNTVAKLNSFFNILSNDYEITNRFVNKVIMRNLCSMNQIPIPSYAKISNVNELELFIARNDLPIILKPADSQSSRGVYKIDKDSCSNLEHFVINSLKYTNCGYLIAEDFIEGQEVTVEGIASNFKHKTLAISLKNHFRTGIASALEYPADIPSDLYSELERINDVLVEKSGLRYGLTHAEYIINTESRKIKLVEIACRGGGTLISSDIVNWVSGINLYELFYANLIGEIIDVKALKPSKRAALLQFFEFEKGQVKSIKGLENAKKIEGIHHVALSFNIGDKLLPAEDDRSRQGFFIAFCNNREELKIVRNQIYNTIKIEYE
jgi:aminotransferase